MNDLSISIDGGRKHYKPGETVTGQIQWTLPEAPKALELRLFWYTLGRGDQDAGIATTTRFEAPQKMGSGPFDLDLPAGPYSFSGSLISLCWALELVTLPGKETAREEIVIAPHESEIELGTAAD